MDKELFKKECEYYVDFKGVGDKTQKARDLTKLLALGEIAMQKFSNEQTTEVANTICSSYYFGKKNA